VMTFLDWKWSSTGSVPSISSLIECGVALLNYCREDGETSTGGFTALRKGHLLDLNFSLTGWTSEPEEEKS
jgi:hypothetical protein